MSQHQTLIMTEKQLQHTPIHYWVNSSKSKKAIIFVHPAFADHTCFDEQLDYFKDYKVITIDLIGHGKSLGKGTIADTAKYIDQILAVEKIEKINLVGVSIGAVVVQDFANKFPEKVASLTCIGGYDISNFDKNLQKDNSKQQRKMIFKAIFSTEDFARKNSEIAAHAKAAQDRFYQMSLKFKKSSLRYLASLGKMVNKFSTKKRGYPLLIGVGEFDNKMAKQAAMSWHKSEPDSKYIEFSGAGHVVNMDAPVQFNRALEKTLR